MEDSMRSLVRSASLAIVIAASSAVLWSQTARPPQSPYLAPADNLVALRSSRMFDARAGTILNNQIILIRGDRIADVGPSVQIPPEARVIDLSGATVLPGMIDAHVHNAGRGDSLEMKTIVMVQSASRDLEAGFTTTVDMDSRGGFGTVDLRNAIAAGLIKGPRMQVAGQSLNQRASAPYPNPGPGAYAGFTEGKNINGPWLARAAVRESKLHGVDWIKIYTTQDFVGEELDEFKPDGSLVASPSLTFEEVQAIVDEAHRMGLRVACHTYGGEGMRSCINAGVDSPNHLLELDDAGVKLLLQKKLFFVPTIDDLISLEKADLRETGGRNSRLRLMERAFKRAIAAGVTIVFGSGATSATIPHGRQADQFRYV